MSETVAAVVVTYNRKQLLTECLDALVVQTRAVDKIILIDNASTDGTSELLEERGYLSAPLIDYVVLSENTGGAGGFYEGVKRGYQAGYDWLWLMDDDCICKEDALASLLDAIVNVPVEIGFACSKTLWVDMKVHYMNIPIISSLTNKTPFNEFDENGVLLVDSCSFVSSIVSRKAINEVGFPIKEMFIWGDDVEYFRRITRAGYFGIYVSKSIAIHKTMRNYAADLFEDEPSNFWKHAYAIRNYVYISRIYRGAFYSFFYVFYRLTLFNLRIIKRRKNQKMCAIFVNSKSSFLGLFFYPKKM